MKFLTPKTMMTAMLMVGALFFASCGDDDDKVDCDKVYDDVGDAFDDYYDAYDNGDCEDLDDLYDDVVKLLRKGKSCSNIKSELEDAGYDNVEDFIDDFEDEHDDNVDTCGDPI